MADDAIFYKMRSREACFHGGFKYWYNRNYTNKDGQVTEYYICDNK